MPTLRNSIEATCSANALYEYITQPWLWHEWHPNSVSSSADTRSLSAGDQFVEQFEIEPVPLLPLTIRRQLRYTVIDAKPPSYWEIKATASDGSAEIHFRYFFEPSDEGVRFTRELRYEIKGIMRLLAPLMRRANKRNSAIAMECLLNRANELAHNNV